MSVRAHYENHLAPVYAWMLGDFSDRVAEQKAFFSSHAITPGEHKIAYDLGSGNGIQALALASLGFQVTAVDFSQYLLTQLSKEGGSHSVITVESDILAFLEQVQSRPALITCMGDTLTHLKDAQAVEYMISRAANLLIEDGAIVLSFRDLSVELKSTDRFIHVRSDDVRTMTCFLEFFPDYVMVHDIITEKEEGLWRQRVSNYRKLRIAENTVIKLMTQNGISVVSRTVVRGMLYLIGRKSIQKQPSA